MNKIFKTHKELLEAIITVNGDCLKTEWCIDCPFVNKCILSYIDQKTYLLTKEERVNLAYDELFIITFEEEINEEDNHYTK